MFSIIQSLITNLLLWIWIGTALFLWWITRGNRRFRRYGFCFLAFFWVLSTRPVADAVLWPLESSYTVPAISSLKVQGIDQIVVLAGGGGGGLKTEDSGQWSPQLNTLEGNPGEIRYAVVNELHGVNPVQRGREDRRQRSEVGSRMSA